MKKNFTFMKTMLVVALMSLWGFTAEAGTGTATDPYTCTELISNGKNVPAGTYVTGYVVGGRYDNFSKPWTNEFAISIADDASETDVNNCVQLKLSTAQRPQWHPKNNPAVIGKQVLASGGGNGYGGYVALENSVTIALVTTSPTITASPTSASLSAAVGATATQDITVGGGKLNRRY